MTDAYVKFRNEMLAGGTEGPKDGDTVGGVRAVIGIGVILALLAWLAVANGWQFIFVIGLLVSIFLHEVGHFVTARLTGMKATQFFLFMGPKLWSFQRGETEYGVRAYPVGAFVKIIGMNNLDEIDPADEPRAYRNKSFPRRLLVITAGSLMHLLIAVALLFGVYSIKGEPVDAPRVQLTPATTGISPARDAGVRRGDTVVSIDGATVTSPDQFVARIRSHAPGDSVELVVQHTDGTTLSTTITLGTNPTDASRGYLGVSSNRPIEWRETSLVDAAGMSVSRLGTSMWDSVGGLVKVLNPVNILDHVTGKNTDETTRPGTVVGATQVAGEVGRDLGLAGSLLLLAGLNVFIGLFNMVPLLPFDGGHAVLAIYERIRSRPGRPYHADVRKLIPVSLVTIGFLLFLFLSSLYLDVRGPVR